jgi:hypothetical protein
MLWQLVSNFGKPIANLSDVNHLRSCTKAQTTFSSSPFFELFKITMSGLFRPSRPSSRQSLQSNPASPKPPPSTMKGSPDTLGEELVYENEDGTLTYLKTDGDGVEKVDEDIKDGETQSETGKVKQMMGILRKMLGVKGKLLGG